MESLYAFSIAVINEEAAQKCRLLFQVELQNDLARTVGERPGGLDISIDHVFGIIVVARLIP